MRMVRFLVSGVGRINRNAVELSRHAGMDCRHPGHRDVIHLGHPWPLGSGNPCRNDGPKLIFNNIED
jgi:hypothetical protein